MASVKLLLNPPVGVFEEQGRKHLALTKAQRKFGFLLTTRWQRRQLRS